MKEQNPAIEELRQKADIVEVASDYMALKKRGKNHLALCPFHSEKTPSFTVSQEKQLFHCFGCGEGGNVFSFLMKIENISFWEAAKILADKYSVDLNIPDFKPGQDFSRKKLLFDITAEAADFFCRQLSGSKTASDYISSRGLKEKAVSFFRIGYSPEGWDGLYRHLLSKGFMPKDIEAAGLILPRADRENSYYDRFRNRLMIPVFDIKGNIAGFGARSLDGAEPKYLNSPDSPVYNKSNILYGLNFSKEEIKKQDSVLIVEGYMDLIACFSAGIKNAAASSGTALTSSHAKTLQRLTDNFYLVFDGDNAGSLATERSISLLKELDIYPKVVLLKGGKDPDEIIKKEGPDGFRDLIANAIPWIEYKIRRAISRHNTKEAEGKSKALKECALILSAEKDAVIRKEYARSVASKLGIDAETVVSEIKRGAFYSGSVSRSSALKKPEPKHLAAEKMILKFASEDKDSLDIIKKDLAPDDFSDDNFRAIFGMLLSVADSAPDDMTATVAQRLDEATGKVFSGLMLEEFEFDNREKAMEDCVNVLKARRITKKMSDLRDRIGEAEKRSDFQAISALQEEYKKYHGEMRAFSGEF
mgnify:FL=1